MSLLLFYGGSPNPSIRGGVRGSIASSLNVNPLQAVLYNTARDVFVRKLGQVYNLKIRWALPGGIQRFEVTVKADSRQDAFDRYKTNLDTALKGEHGNGIAIADRFIDFPIADGWVYEIRIDGLFVTYICGSTWERCKDEYQTSNPSGAGIDTSTYLTDTLTAVVPAGSSDYSQVETSGVSMGSTYAVNVDFGNTAQQIIKDLVKMGTSTAGELIDFYFVPTAFDGIFPQLPRPVFKARTNTVTGWSISRFDISSLSIGSHIWRLKNNVSVKYGSGTATATNAASQSAYWERQHKEAQSTFDATQGQNWADTLTEYDNEPQQQVSFTIDNPMLRSSRAGGVWPSSRMMVFAESIAIRDLFPVVEQAQIPNNGNTGFRPVALDYDYSNQKIRVTPDNKDGDQRLDVILQQLGAQVGQTIGV